MPKTPKGKAKSSQNSRTHGVLAKKMRILPDEKQEQYDAVVQGWMAQWEPTDYQEHKLVETLIENDWQHRRAQRRLLETEASIIEANGADPAEWTAEQTHRLELMQRYKTTAERAFYKSWGVLQGLRKDIMRIEKENSKLRAENERYRRDEERRQAAGEKASQPKVEKAKTSLTKAPLTKAQQMFQGQKSAKKRKKITILDQWVEIEVSPSGKTVTTLYPSNEILIADGQKKWPPPEMVYRRLNFVDGVPHEYHWTTSDETLRERGGCGIQRMTVDTWLELIEKEKALGTGHILPTGNLPRPEERGGCDCKVCSHNRAVLEGAA